MFSTASWAGESTTEKRNRLADRNLETIPSAMFLHRLAVALACNHLRSAFIVYNNYCFRLATWLLH